ncbi:MAG: hypothetical protein QNK37_35260 [Acidobacteriota bacterium]|nr:hypothetical protein [Acidobacteriota bacterium]
MDFELVLLIMSLTPDRLYTVRQIAGGDQQTYHRLYAFISNRRLRPDGQAELKGRMIQVFYGVSLMNAVSDLSRMRYALFSRMDAIRNEIAQTPKGLLLIEQELTFMSILNNNHVMMTRAKRVRKLRSWIDHIILKVWMAFNRS